MHVLHGYVLRALSDIRIVTVIELRKRSHKNYAQPAFLVNKAQHNQTLGYLTYSAYFPSVFIHKDILWRFWMEGKPSLDWQKFSIKMKEEYGILSKIMEQNHYISALIFPPFNSCVSPSENRVWCQNYFFIQNFVSFQNSCSLTTHLSTFLNFLSLTSQFNSVKLLFISHLIVKMKGTEWLVLFLAH